VSIYEFLNVTLLECNLLNVQILHVCLLNHNILEFIEEKYFFRKTQKSNIILFMLKWVLFNFSVEHTLIPI